MTNNVSVKIAEHFGELKDPRVERTKEHKLLDIVVIAICAVICGSNDREGIAEYGRDQEAWLGTFLALPNGIPSHDTFWRIGCGTIRTLFCELGAGGDAVVWWGSDCD